MAFHPLRDLPSGILSLGREILRHLLRRPVIGIAMAVRNEEGQWLFVKRTDSGAWALPGGTLEWGEMLSESWRRELQEETGLVEAEFLRLVGVFSRPDRDPRFHAVTVLILCADRTAVPLGAVNPAEISDVRWFHPDEVPRPLSHGLDDLFDAARRETSPCLE